MSITKKEQFEKYRLTRGLSGPKDKSQLFDAPSGKVSSDSMRLSGI